MKQKHRLKEGTEILLRVSPEKVCDIMERKLDWELGALVFRPRSATN